MITRILVMMPGGTSRVEELDWNPKETFDRQLAKYFNGHWTEHVSVRYLGQNKDMFVDEAGAIKGMPRNDQAGVIYGGPIFGPAVLFLDHKVWK